MTDTPATIIIITADTTVQGVAVTMLDAMIYAESNLLGAPIVWARVTRGYALGHDASPDHGNHRVVVLDPGVASTLQAIALTLWVRGGRDALVDDLLN